MSLVVSLSELILAAVFAVAGVAKLLAPAGTRRAIAEFGAPARSVAALSVGLPLVEIGIAAGLIWSRSAQWAAVAAAALLLIFCVAIVRALARGSAPDCNCFGNLTQTAVGKRTLIRNAALAALAAVAAAGTREPTGALGWLEDTAASETAATAVIAALTAALAGLAWFSWQLLRQNGRLLLRLDAQAEEMGAGEPLPGAGPGVGDEAPSFPALESLLLERRPLVLLFSHGDCPACGEVLREAAAAERERAGEVSIAVVTRGGGEGAGKARNAGLRYVIDDVDGSLFSAYAPAGVPAALIVDTEGRIKSPWAEGADGVRELIAGAGARPALLGAGG